MKVTNILTNYSIRKAKVVDVQNIAILHLESSYESYKDLIDQDYLRKRNYLKKIQEHKERIEKGKDLYLIAENQGKIIGFCSAAPLKFHPNQKFSAAQKLKRHEKGEIDNLYVHSNYHKMGIGRKLFDTAKLWLEENQLIPFLVWVYKDNFKARTFYEHLGGKLVDEVLVSIGDKEYLEAAYKFE